MAKMRELNLLLCPPNNKEQIKASFISSDFLYFSYFYSFSFNFRLLIAPQMDGFIEVGVVSCQLYM